VSLQETKLAPLLRSEPAASSGLGVIRKLLDELHAEGITYCHWKSNEHLEAALAGLTDLDVLVDRRQNQVLQRVLSEIGFKRFATPPLRVYPAIEDHLAFDPATGQLVHLHLHYQLTLGERHLKGYRLPWEALALATRSFDPAHGVYIIDPALEFVLLLTRATLKRRVRDHFRSQRNASLATGDFGREFDWLRHRVDSCAVNELACKLLGPTVAKPLRTLLSEPPAPGPFATFAAAARPILARYRTYSPVEARLRAWVRELQWIVDAVNRRYLHRAIPLRRISPRGGVLIVFLGSDGAGKSTVNRALAAWLRSKLDVVPIYFGSGDGPSAIYRRPMQLAFGLLRWFQGPDSARSRAERAATPASGTGDRLRKIARVPWALALSYEKREKLRRAIRARNRGMIVVCDRFPQAEVAGFNDGPLLAHWRKHQGSLRSALARWEARPYADTSVDPPDLVIKLTVSPEVALSRKPEMTLTEVERRIQAVQNLRFPPTTKVVKLDADAPLEEVVKMVKWLIWQEI
jgi:thymidylate kinase